MTLRARLEYRADFMLAILSGVAWQMSVLLIIGVLLTQFRLLGGWTGGEVVLLVGIRMAAHGLYVCLFSNIVFVPFMVEEGRIEIYQLRPLPMLTQVLLTTCNINGIGDLAVGVTFLLIAIQEANIHWTIVKVAFLLSAITGGALLEAAMLLLTIFNG